MMTKYNVTFTPVFSGYGDYFGGWGGLGHDEESGSGKALLYAFYGKNTSLRDCIDQWRDDYSGADCYDVPEDVDIAGAVMDCLNDRGRADYASGAIAEVSEEWMACNDIDPESEDDDDDDWGESPVWIGLLEWEVCDDCDS
jgi:hypothetical protein